METVTIGIDLGATNTFACYMKKGKPTLCNFYGDIDGEKMPSLVYVEKDGSLTIGCAAESNGYVNPDHLIRFSPTYMGDPSKHYVMRGKSLTPTDVAAEILCHVKTRLTNRLRKSDNDTAVKAVIAVPEYFSGIQEAEMKKAGECAGIEVVRIITEPMAAAVAAGWTKELKGKLLVVYIDDGSFSLSILEADPPAENYKVIDTAVDRSLGGDDFDRTLCDYFLERLGEKTGMDFSTPDACGLDEIEYNILRWYHLKREAERTLTYMGDFSELTEWEVCIPSLFTYKGSPYDFEIVVDREQLDEIFQSIYQKISVKLENFLQKSLFSIDMIDSVIVVGDSRYISHICAGAETLAHQQEVTQLDLTAFAVGACIAGEHESGRYEWQNDDLVK